MKNNKNKFDKIIETIGFDLSNPITLMHLMLWFLINVKAIMHKEVIFVVFYNMIFFQLSYSAKKGRVENEEKEKKVNKSE